jgi:Lamin Tail Domain
MSAVLLAACPADDGANDASASNTDPSSSSDPSTTVSPTTTMTTDPSTATESDTNPTGPTTTDPTATETDPTTGVDPDSSSSSSASDSSSGGSSDSSSGGSESSSSTGAGEAIVVINEFSSNNDGVIGEDPIELYNAGDGDADLSGWVLTDDTSDPYDIDVDLEEFVFPKGATLAAGGFLVVVGGTDDGHPFGLSGGGDTARLFDAELNEIDIVTYGATEAAVSYCRMPDGPDGAWQADCTETFGASNG